MGEWVLPRYGGYFHKMSEWHIEVESVRPPWARDLEESVDAKFKVMQARISELKARLVSPVDAKVNALGGRARAWADG